MIPLRPATLLLLAIFGSLVSGPAHAAWTAQGVVLSTGTASGTSYSEEVAAMQLVPDGQGGAFAIWSNQRVRVQRVTSDGEISTGWPVDGVLISRTSLGGTQNFPRAISDGAGGVIVAWWDTRQGQNRILAQKVTGSSALVWSDSGRVLSSGVASGFDIASDDNGGAFVGWSDSGREQLRAVHLDGSGTLVAGWPALGLQVCPAAVHPITPTLAADGTGGVFMAWIEPREVISWSLFSTRLNSDGTLATGWPAAGTLLCQAHERRQEPTAIADGEGGAWVAWDDSRSSNNYDLYAQRVLDDGSLSSGATTSGRLVSDAVGIQSRQRVVPDGSGGVIVVWSDTRSGSYDLYASRLLPDGSLAGGWVPNGTPLCTLPLRQWQLQVIGDGTGGALVGWTDLRNGLDDDIYVSRVTGSGSIAPGWAATGMAVCTAPGDQGPSAICTDGSGGAILAWRDFRRGNDFSPDIYAARVSMDGLVPVLVSLIEAVASDRGVRVEWQLAVPSFMRPSAERREPTTGWVALREPSVDGTGRCRIEDPEVAPGGHYGYRLSWSDAGGVRITSEEVWLSVPASFEFGVRGVHPNPIRESSAIIHLQLIGASPATLEWFDVRGRRVAYRTLAAPNGGHLTLGLEDERRLPSGLYFIRLRQAERSAWSRVAIAR